MQRRGGGNAWAGSWLLPWVWGAVAARRRFLRTRRSWTLSEFHSGDGTADVLFLAIDRCQETLFLSLNPSIELIETTRERVELIISDTRHRRDHVGGSRFQKSFDTKGRKGTEGFFVSVRIQFASRLFRPASDLPPAPQSSTTNHKAPQAEASS